MDSVDISIEEQEAWWLNNFNEALKYLESEIKAPPSNLIFEWLEVWCLMIFVFIYEAMIVMHEGHMFVSDSITVEEVELWIDNLTPSVAALLQERADSSLHFWNFLRPKIDYEKHVRSRLLGYFQESIPRIPINGVTDARRIAGSIIMLRAVYDSKMEGRVFKTDLSIFRKMSDDTSTFSRAYWQDRYPVEEGPTSHP